MEPKIIDNSESDFHYEDEIDLTYIFKSLIRNKFILIGSIGISLVFTSISYITTSPRWKGDFQIVLEKSNDNNSRLQNFLGENSALISLVGSGGDLSKNALSTEVEILESPLVLKPVYDFVKEKKTSLGLNTKNWTYKQWVKSNLKINLKKGTSVLNISLTDVDKDLILPTLERISYQYQKYSGRDREKGLSQGIQYLNDQIKKTSISSKKSLYALQEFSIENNLGNEDGLPPLKTSSGINNFQVGLTGSSSDKILESLQNSYETDSSKSSSRYKLHFNKLAILEAELVDKSALLTPNSEQIKSLKTRINILKESVTRPKEILLEYRELKRIALRDESILSNLESQLRALELEKARRTDPWELISSPIILEYPISPRKRIYLAWGLLVGLIPGIIIALLKDKYLDLIYEPKEFKKLIKYPLLKTLSIDRKKEWKTSISLIAEKYFRKDTKIQIALIPLNNSLLDDAKYISDIFTNHNDHIDIIISSDLLETSKANNQILLVSQETITKSDLLLLVEDLKLQGSPVLGFIFIDKETKNLNSKKILDSLLNKFFQIKKLFLNLF